MEYNDYQGIILNDDDNKQIAKDILKNIYTLSQDGTINTGYTLMEQLTLAIL